MLKHLHISNYALIESLDIDICEGFSVITGETGAGKSILLGAIGLLTGGRADLTAIQSGKQRCTLEAIFDIHDYGLESIFQEEDLDYDPSECIIRRELTTNGKSRAFVNDTPTTVATLKRLGNYLIDIHSQHQNLLIGQENFQLSVLDTVAESSMLHKSYSEAYTHWKSTSKALDKARTELAENRKDEDYLRFLVTELADFRPEAGEDETLRQQCDTLEHAQDIRMAMMQGYGNLSEGDTPVTDILKQVRNHISSIQAYFPRAEELTERLESCRIELQDIADTMETEAERVDCNPELLERVQSRLNTLYTLEQKHHVTTSDELATLLTEMQKRLNMMDNSDEYLLKLQQQEAEALAKVHAMAKHITKARTNAAEKVKKDIIAMLKTLGMPNVRFDVSITPTEPGANGMDKVAFLFSANPGAAMQNISQVASGGETARVMLSLKALLSNVTSLPTIIFDEIDTGVSGRIAESMAHIMRQMGEHGRQVISITHLPQIAAMGSHHYKVSKDVSGNETRSHITKLTQNERVAEIANMLSGSNVTPEAINNARALLGL
ncbi:MAG: DNA repair protein RecN [Bacteroides sp.]|nr:DNA repair protein RecN [Bacteroides sp.]MCM1448622.1 DNA repair protein RecN [Bacteroides sp.]